VGWSVGELIEGAVIVSVGTGRIVRLTTIAVAWPNASSTRTVSDVVPTTVGVPESRPSWLSVRPATLPAASVHVRGRLPPPTVNCWEYLRLTTPEGRATGEMLPSGVVELIVTVTGAEVLGLLLPSPAYTAVNECVPTDSVEVVTVATPFTSGAVPSAPPGAST